MTAPRSDPALPVTGRTRVAGHFGEWLQGRMGPEGPLVLVTLACPALGVAALVGEDADTDVDTDTGTGADGAALLDPGQLAAAQKAFGLRAPLRLVAEMPPGCGTGMSTAALVALARAAGFAGDLAQAALAIEGATDPLMLAAPDRALWAPRAARAVQVLPAPPRAEVLGGLLPGRIYTDPADMDFPDIADLARDWPAACDDLAWAARLASLSAARTTARRGPDGDPSAALARELGALGWVRAHTGTARGFLFAPGHVPEGAEAHLKAAGLSRVLRFATGGAGEGEGAA